MNTITLSVTKKTAAYLADRPDMGGRQIAVKDATPVIRAALDKAGKKALVTIRLGGRINLVVGDTHAIWRSHNMSRTDEYDCLFDLLALRPGVAMLFPCEIVSRRIETPATVLFHE